MSLLGKVLLIINLLVAVGVVYLATASFGAREQQNIALVKQELLTSGIPFDGPKGTVKDPKSEVQFVIVLGSGRTLEKLPGRVLIEHFQGLVHGDELVGTDLAPPLSILAEVDDAEKVLIAKSNGFAGNAANGLDWLVGKLGADGRFAPGLLAKLAEDFDERATYREWLERAKAEPQEAARFYGFAQDILKKKFALAAKQANPAEAAAQSAAIVRTRSDVVVAFQEFCKANPQQINAASAKLKKAEDAYWTEFTKPVASVSEVERRRMAAALLVTLDTTATGQKRTAFALGLPAYTKALNDRLARLLGVPSQLKDALSRELATFTALYERDLRASTEIDQVLNRQKNDITSKVIPAAEQAKQNLTARESELNAATQRADVIAARVKARAIEQSGLEREIFDLQQDVGTLLAETFELEDRLLLAERKRLSAGK